MTTLKKQTMHRKNWMQHISLLLLFLGLGSCASKGLKVTACVVDSGNSGFQCATSAKDRFFLSFEEGKTFQCVSPSDLEDILKACKNHKILATTVCHLTKDLSEFECKPVSGELFYLQPIEADNYFCMSPQDYKRVMQRCQMPSESLSHVQGTDLTVLLGK